MHTYLVFRLYGPLCSWGDIAVGEIRPSSTHPSKSAVVGLLAAALRIKRDEESILRDLGSSFALCVVAESIGRPLFDYHTVQVPPSRSGRKSMCYRSRKDELEFLPKSELNTILSYRDYRCDAAYVVVLQQIQGAAFTADACRRALLEPAFHLYLGRKSCPLALPLEPTVIEEENIEMVLKKMRFDAPLLGLKQGQRELYWEEGMDMSNIVAKERFERRDVPLSRIRWQFDTRKEHHAPMSVGE